MLRGSGVAPCKRHSKRAAHHLDLVRHGTVVIFKTLSVNFVRGVCCVLESVHCHFYPSSRSLRLDLLDLISTLEFDPLFFLLLLLLLLFAGASTSTAFANWSTTRALSLQSRTISTLPLERWARLLD